jgi:hypothetical protein
MSVWYGWAYCPDIENSVQTFYWEGGNVKHLCINWKIVPKQILEKSVVRVNKIKLPSDMFSWWELV